MKGVLFTFTVMIIMGFIITYFAVSALSNVDRSGFANERLASQRIYYTWMSISDNFRGVLNFTFNKNGQMAEFNDTLPANVSDVVTLLTRLQQFIEQHIEDPTIFIRFEDSEGNKVNLNSTDCPKNKVNCGVKIKPMNIDYSWPDYGKREVWIKVKPENFSYIQNITYELTTNTSFRVDTIPNPKECPADYCLNFTLRVKNSSYTWEWSVHRFDVQSVNWAEISVGGVPSVAKVETGDIDNPSNTVLHVNLIKDGYVFNTYLKLYLNTTEFYIDFPIKLNVTSGFARRIDYI